jgi:hypothetical protein
MCSFNRPYIRGSLVNAIAFRVHRVTLNHDCAAGAHAQLRHMDSAEPDGQLLTLLASSAHAFGAALPSRPSVRPDPCYAW